MFGAFDKAGAGLSFLTGSEAFAAERAVAFAADEILVLIEEYDVVAVVEGFFGGVVDVGVGVNGGFSDELPVVEFAFECDSLAEVDHVDFFLAVSVAESGFLEFALAGFADDGDGGVGGGGVEDEQGEVNAGSKEVHERAGTMPGVGLHVVLL